MTSFSSPLILLFTPIAKGLGATSLSPSSCFFRLSKRQLSFSGGPGSENESGRTLVESVPSTLRDRTPSFSFVKITAVVPKDRCRFETYRSRHIVRFMHPPLLLLLSLHLRLHLLSSRVPN